MGYQFSPGWPYSSTTFPSMDDHVDPVNNAYFSGLHDEIEKIEYYLGLHPQGAYGNVEERIQAGFDYTENNYNIVMNYLGHNVAEGFTNVKDKLETHGHTGGVDGTVLEGMDPIIWEAALSITNWVDTRIDATAGASAAGFAYYDLLYNGPCERDAGNASILCYNTSLSENYHQEVTSWGTQPRGTLVIDTTAYISLIGTPGLVGKFGILDWSENTINLGAGANNTGHIVELGDYLYTPCYTTPVKLVRIKKSDDSLTYYDMDSDEDNAIAICTDGTYIYFATKTTPVKIIRFNPGTGAHSTFTITDFDEEVIFMIVVNNTLYAFNDAATAQYIRMNLTTQAYQLFEPDWIGGTKNGTWWPPYILLHSYSGVIEKFIAFNPITNKAYISVNQGERGAGFVMTVVMNHLHPGGVIEGYHNYIGELTPPDV